MEIRKKEKYRQCITKPLIGYWCLCKALNLFLSFTNKYVFGKVQIAVRTPILCLFQQSIRVCLTGAHAFMMYGVGNRLNELYVGCVLTSRWRWCLRKWVQCQASPQQEEQLFLSGESFFLFPFLSYIFVHFFKMLKKSRVLAYILELCVNMTLIFTRQFISRTCVQVTVKLTFPKNDPLNSREKTS